MTETRATEFYVDGDACPVKDEVMRVAERHGLRVHFVSNSGMRLYDSPLVNPVVVAEGPDAADDWIAENITDRDIAVTADIPLAARCLEKNAQAIGPTGRAFTKNSIGSALAMRDLNAHLRETGAMSSNAPGFTRRDRSQFLQTLEQAVQDLKRR